MFKVLKSFIDKETMKKYTSNSEYSPSSTDRANELVSKGFLGYVEKEEPKSIISVESMLDQNANTVISIITNDTDEETLTILLKAESEGKNRKTVKEHIESLLKGDADESSEV